MKRMNTAVIGCGKISDIYLTNLIGPFSGAVEVTACCAKTFSHARAKAEKYGIRAMTLEEILEDQEVELVVVLTPPAAHKSIIYDALMHGKHVYSEKVFATSFTDGLGLLRLAKERGLQLSSAPDTFFGDGIQTARRAIDKGKLGKVTGFQISLNRNNGYFYEKLPFTRQKGAGIGYDMGIYPLTALFYLLGGAEEVSGLAMTSRPARLEMDCKMSGKKREFRVENENIMAAVIHLKQGAVGTLFLNGDSSFPSRRSMTIYGTEGILEVPDPAEFGGMSRLFYADCPDGSGWVEGLPGPGRFMCNSRGAGVAETAWAIRMGQKTRTDAGFAIHGIELLDRICEAGKNGITQKLITTIERPNPAWEMEEWMEHGESKTGNTFS